VERQTDANVGSKQPHSWPRLHEWLLFTAQVLLVGMVQVSDDIIRGNFWHADPVQALRNAHDVATFEARHGFFVEPAIQTFFLHPRSIVGLTLTWSVVSSVADSIYALCHIFVTLTVAIWIFLRHRRSFPLLRDVTLFTNLLALVGYELYPLTPPRLTTGLIWDHHAFIFHDTMRHVIGTGMLNGTPIGYNPLSAMPSLHVAWAIIVGATVFMFVRSPFLRILAASYPFIVIFVTVVTANHYVMDAAGATGTVAVAALLAWAVDRARWRVLNRSGLRVLPASRIAVGR
jgi:PAP2 superfamily